MSTELLRQIVSETLQLPLESVPADSSSETLENWDSLRHLDIVMAVESATGVRFSTTEIAELTSINKLEQALAARGWKA